MLTPGEVRVVYFSAGGKDILGRSGLLAVRSNINISHSSEIEILHIPSGPEILLHHHRRSRPERRLKESCNVLYLTVIQINIFLIFEINKYIK